MLQEIKKIIRNRALAVLFFLVLVVIFCFGHLYSHQVQIDCLQAVFAKAGTVYNAHYEETILSLQQDADAYPVVDLYSNMKKNLQTDRYFFDTYDARAIYETLECATDSSGRNISPTALFFMRYKYDYLEKCVIQLATDGSEEDVYFDYLTASVHNDLFVNFGTIVSVLCSAFAVLCVLTSLSEENLCDTQALVFSCKFGRRLQVQKIVASVLVSSFVFLVVFGLGYGFVFLQNDFTNIWQQSVSSVNNLCITHDAYGPFVSWGSMTVGTYFAASVVVSWLVMLGFLLFAAAFGCVNGHILPTAGFFFGLQALILVLIAVPCSSPSSFVFYLLRMTGVGLLYDRGVWFSEGGYLTLVPYFETVCALLFIVFGLLCVFLSYRRYLKINL